MRDPGSIPGLGRSPGERQGNPLQYSCLENPHVQRSLVGYSPRGRKELDMTESPGSPRRQRATSPSAWEARVRRKRVWHGGQRMEGPEERPRGFKGVEGNIEGAEWGRMSGSSGKREVSEKQDWADPQFPTEAPISVSKVMPARKQAELRTYSHMSPRRGFQLTEKLPSGKQNQKEKTEASKEPRGKNSQPRTRGLNPRLTKRARKKFSSPGSQKVNFNLKQRTKPRTQGVNESHSKQRARKKALQPSVYWSLSHAQLFANPWTLAHQAPLSMGFPRQEYLSGLPFPSLGESSQPRVEPGSPILLLSTLCHLMCTSLWNVPLVSLIFLKRPLVLLILLFPSTFLHCSHRKAFFNLSFLFFGTLYSHGHIFPFLLCL